MTGFKSVAKELIKNYAPKAYRYFGTPHYDEVEIVLETCKQLQIQSGVMLDVGAHLGASALPFLKRNWEIYAFEPDPQHRLILQKKLADFSKAFIDDRAVSEISHQKLPFFNSTESKGISSLLPFHDSHVQCAEVTTITLTDFIREKNIRQVDFLKTDVEGYDLMALRGFPWAQMQPRFLVCEFENRKTEKLGYRYDDIAEYLRQQGYRILKSEWYPIDRYGGQHRWRCVELYPSALHDPLGWGNLIAARNENDFAVLSSVARKRAQLFN